MANATTTANFVAQTIPFTTLCDRAVRTQDFYKQQIDPALEQWQAASDTLRAVLLIPCQVVAPYANAAVKNFIMLGFIACYTLFVVWRECAQHTWNCWMGDVLEALEMAQLLESLERPFEAVDQAIRFVVGEPCSGASRAYASSLNKLIVASS